MKTFNDESIRLAHPIEVQPQVFALEDRLAAQAYWQLIVITHLLVLRPASLQD